MFQEKTSLRRALTRAVRSSWALLIVRGRIERYGRGTTHFAALPCDWIPREYPVPSTRLAIVLEGLALDGSNKMRGAHLASNRR